MHKKFIIILLLAGTGIQTRAQFGIQGGLVGVPGEAFPTHDGLDKLGGAMGYTFGVFYNVRISDILVFQPSVNWLNKVWKDELEDVTFQETIKTKVTVNYLELPLQLVYKQSKSFGFLAGVGPSILYGVSGTRTITEDDGFNTTQTKTDYEFGKEDGQEKTLTVSFNAMVGYAFGRLQVHLNYNRGLTNQDTNNNHGNESHLALRIGYAFKK